MKSRLDEISIDREQIGHALKDKRLWVPPNQRDYAWKDKHVEDLYSDFALMISRHAAEYFLGSIVVIKSDNGLMVVDGQQRLATSLILIAAIRDYFDETEDEVAARFYDETYLLSKLSRAKDPEPHLYLNQGDHGYFLARILLRKKDEKRKTAEASKPTRPSHQRIDKAAKLAAKRVKEIISPVKKEHQAEQLDVWTKFLDEKARVIWVTVPDESSAYVIFETMNDRGLELSATDLIKNYLFGRAEEKIESVKHHWFTMVGSLEAVAGPETLKDFVRHYWIANYGLTRSSELFEAIKIRVKSSPSAVELSEDLTREAIKYAALLSVSHPIWNDYPEAARKSVETLNLLGVEQIRPLLLAALGKFSSKDMSSLLMMCVSWSVRFYVAGTQGSGALEGVYATAAHNVCTGSFKSPTDVASHLQRQVPTDAKFEKDFSEAHVGKSHLARYYLRSLERQFRNEGEPYFIPNDQTVINLEHILPENPSDDWAHVPEEIRETYASRLGNQVLLQASVNSKLGNSGYAVKKPKLLAADFELTKLAGIDSDWGQNEIEERQRKLAQLAVKTWPLRAK